MKIEGKKYIELDPELARIFRESKTVSTNNGNAYHLFKANAKRRRTKQEIEEEKLAEAAKKIEVEMKLQRMADIER